MANVQVAGFQPRSKGNQTVELVRLRVLTNNTDPIAKGDALDFAATGDVIAHTTEAGEVYSVQWGGASYYASGSRVERNVLPAATLYTSSGVDPINASYVYGVDDMVNTKFTASIDEAVALTDRNLNFAMVLTVATGDTSLHELDATGKNTTATIPWRFLDFVLGDPTSNPDEADAKVVVLANAARREPALELSGSEGG
jgi:hypothetical protein